MTNKIQQAFDNIQADPRLVEATKRALAAKRTKKSHKKPGLILALACMTLSFIAGMQAYAWILTPVSYVSIDVNPSMELALNRLDRVVSASPYNDEGAEILNGLQLRWKKYTDAIKTIMESNTMSTYLLLLQYDADITIDQCKDMSISEIRALIQKFQQEESLSQEEDLPEEDLFEEDLFQEDLPQEDLLQEDLFEEDLFQEDLFQEDLSQEEPPQQETPSYTGEVYNVPAHDQNEHHHGGHH